MKQYVTIAVNEFGQWNLVQRVFNASGNSYESNVVPGSYGSRESAVKEANLMKQHYDLDVRL